MKRSDNSRGGKRRLETLTPERRSEIARKAGQAAAEKRRSGQTPKQRVAAAKAKLEQFRPGLAWFLKQVMAAPTDDWQRRMLSLLDEDERAVLYGMLGGKFVGFTPDVRAVWWFPDVELPKEEK